MRTSKFIAALAVLALSTPLFAQLAMQLTPNQSTYMQYEPIYFHLRIRNDSGRPIVFGQHKQLMAKLFFEVTDLKGNILDGISADPIPLTRGKVINPNQTGDIILKFSKYYKLQHIGSYRIHAYISHPLFKDKFKSNDISISIASGVKIWSRTLGMADGSINEKGEVITTDSTRTYSIKKLIDGSRQYYYCTLEDKERVYQVFRMAPVSNSSPPTYMVDMAGALHMLVNIAPKVFKYYKLDITGELIDDGKYYKITKTQPRLFKGKDGKIFITGGDLATPNVDFLVREQSFTMAE